VKVGVILPLFSGDPAKVRNAAREAETLGFDGVFAFDHFFPPGASPDRPSLEAFASLGSVAAVTDRVVLGTLVARAGLRPVGLLAKTAGWLDQASDGRFVLGIGTGDPIDLPEHRAYGIPMLDRRQRREHLEEVLAALGALFRGQRYPGGRFIPPMEGPVAPLGPRPGGPPVWVGAQADDVVRLASRLADGWNGWGLDPDAFGRKVEILRQAAGDRDVEATWSGIVLAGEDRRETGELVERRRARGMDDEAWTGTVEELTGHLRDLEVAGAAWAIMVLAGPADRRRLLADRVLPALSGA
jgi:alkanesulfonate monooxygenase SsuD/methylene tetrahydromethanopterin reductase-like flavin-dependent oxidoreductase (luciferase family)